MREGAKSKKELLGELRELRERVAGLERERLNRVVDAGETAHEPYARQSEGSLRESEERCRSLFERNVAGVYRTTLDGKLLDCNEAMAAMFGYASREELLSRPAIDLYFHPPERAAFVEEMQAHGALKNSEARMKRKDGSPVDILENVALLPDENGEFTIIQGTIVDITERRKAEDSLRRSEALLNATQELTKVGGWEWDVKSRTMYWTDEVYRIHGLTRSEVDLDGDALIQRGLKCYEPEDRPVIQNAFETCAAEGRAYDLEFPFSTCDGRQIWVRTAAKPLMRNGKVAKVIGNLADITDRKQAEDSLRENERKLRNLVEHSNELFYAHDTNHKLTYVSPQSKQIWGYEPDEMLVKWPTLITDNPINQEGLEATEAAIRTGNRQPPYLLEIRTKSGDLRLIEVDESPLKDPEGNVVGITGAARDVTKRTRAEEALRGSEAYSRSLFEYMTNGVAVYQAVDDGEDFVFVDFNPAAEKIENISKEDLIGKRATEAFPGVKSFGIFAVFQRVWRSGRPEYFPERRYEDDRDAGTWRENWVYRLPCGRIVAIYNNVTERKRAEKLLRDSEERLELAMQGAGLGMWDHDMQTDEVVRSPRWAEMLGYTPDEIAPRTDAWRELIHPDDQAAVDQVARMHESGRTPVFQVEHRMRTKSGAWKWILNWGKVVERNRDGAPLRATGIHLDITDRKQAERDLRESEAILNETGEMARIGGWKHDLKTGEAVWTKALYDIIEIEPGPPPDAKEHLDFYPPEHRRVLEEAYQRTANEGKPFDLALQARTATGKLLWCRVHGEPVIQDGECVAIRGTFQDITERKQAEEARLRLEEQLRQSQKMEAVGTLAAGVAHDFNNSLTAILGYAEIARDALPPNHTAMADIDGVIAAANQATGITQGLLTFSRETSAEMKPLDLAQLVRDSSRTLRRMLPAAVEMTIDATETSATWIEGEAVHLNQVLMNLVVNARDAMPDGGPLRISVRHEHSSPFDAWSAVETHGRGFAVLSVEDSGHGMSPDVQARIFDPFFTTKSRGKGTGLGLSVVHGIVEEHHGHIEVHTAEGRGTSMTIGFPCCGGREPVRDAKSETAASGAGRTILLAEDNLQVQSVIAAALEAAGYQVVRADDGEQAWGHFDDQPDRFDLAVLDVDMPKLSGKDCLERIRATTPSFPAVMVTGFYDTVAGYEDLPHTAVMRKPCALADLKRCIGELIASSTARTDKQG